jgi:hypothetical protein
MKGMAFIGFVACAGAAVAAAPTGPANLTVSKLRPPDACALPAAGKIGGQPDWSHARVVRDLQNAAALTFIAGREAGDSEFRYVQNQARKKLRARGLKPTEFARVVRIEIPREPKVAHRHLLDRILNLIEPRVSAEVVDGYDIYASSWDDGDGGTWEGNVYVQELGTGLYISANEQKQLPAQPYEPNWAEQVGTNQKPRPGCQKSGSPCGYCADSGVAGCNLRNAINDRWPYCAGGAAACAWAGPGWLTCAGLNCYGHLFGGWLWQSKMHFQQCWVNEQERINCINP